MVGEEGKQEQLGLEVERASGIPDDWVSNISDDEMREIVSGLVKLALRLPYIRSRVRELVWLICMEDKREGYLK